jgi:group II intron reverse transcriptase/maturase
MNPTKMAEKQRFLARTASEHPDHRFTNLYDLLHWDNWMHISAERVLARPGSQTDGVDRVTRKAFKEDYERQMTTLIDQLKRKTYQPQPVRRVYIPKHDGKKRPLGIPALRDRIVQEALRAILDPIYESDFYRHSYGFRKGRRTMDAIAVLMPLFNTSVKHYYVIEGDLQSYFDTVHHRTLMKLLRRRLKDRALLDLLWKFLKAGVMEGGLFARTECGVPQGGVISPLLANVYLNEFDQWAAAQWDLDQNTRRRRRYAGLGNYKMVRYADDFVVVSNGPITEVKATKQAIQQFLENELHLTLSEEKTVITHVNDGFDFLGFHIQRKRVNGRWAVHLRPTAKAKERVKRKLKDLTSRNWTWMDEYNRLATLNAIVRGWAEYYRYTSLVQDIEDITRFTWFRYLYWLRKKHKGSHKGQLMKAKTRRLHGRTRWHAEVREGGNTLETYQWLPTRQELDRQRYRRKGEAEFPHPYLSGHAAATGDCPQGETGPDEHIYAATIGASSFNRGEPLEIVERRLRAKVRDGMKCQQCGSRTDLHVHHTKGMKSHALSNLVTLCRTCHIAIHRSSQLQTV